MEINNRFKILRKELRLTQAEFGNSIGLKQSAIAEIEMGRSRVTEMVIKTIVFRHSVSRTWLETGQLPMFSNQKKEAAPESPIPKSWMDEKVDLLQSKIAAQEALIKAMYEVSELKTEVLKLRKLLGLPNEE